MITNLSKKIIAVVLGLATFAPASVATYKVFASKLEDAPESPVLSVAGSDSTLELQSENSANDDADPSNDQNTSTSNLVPISPVITGSPSPTVSTVSFPKADSSIKNGENENENELESADKSEKEEDSEGEIRNIDSDDSVEWKNEKHDLVNQNDSTTENNLEITK